MLTPSVDKHLTVGGTTDPFLPVLRAAINRASEISLAVAFIKSTGLSLIMPALEDALGRGASLRILTGDYLEVTDPEALKLLMLLKEQGADVKVHESQGATSFHMKVYLFTNEAESGDGCAFVGSSNLSKAALQHGLEWNLKVERAEDETRFARLQSEYDALYGLPQCRCLTHKWIARYEKRFERRNLDRRPTQPGEEETEPPPTPNPVQIEALAALAATRAEGYRRGLVVMATGLGKTWLAAFDTANINAARVLFVAHREEILSQAEATFVRVRPDATVGRYDGREKRPNVDMVFASVQTLGTSDHLSLFEPDHFDYVVIDEFHHAAARTYQKLLAHFSPRFLLGLTATPERTDQSDILALCDDNLVVLRDLFYGIESGLLCPFEYHGIADEVDYQEIPWRNGRFNPGRLENQLATLGRARHNFRHWDAHKQSRTLAFCVSKKHADFMASYFSEQGIAAASVHSDSTIPRNAALEQLAAGTLEVIFSVDLFNEGVDLPAIDTVLMLRPTESKIVFLQQLGRGLRKSQATGKTRLQVLDFIGNHISFFRKPEALFKLETTTQARKAFLQQLKSMTLKLPRGCFVNFDLKSIGFMEQLVATEGDVQVDRYRNLKESLGRRPSITEFYRAGGAIKALRKDYGHWLAFVHSEGDLCADEAECLERYDQYFLELEKTTLTKSFKLILIEALLELDGFAIPPTLRHLANKSFEIISRRPNLRQDLPDQFRVSRQLDAGELDNWQSYWDKNPVNAWIGGNTQKAAFFKVEADSLTFTRSVSPDDLDTFSTLVQELVNYRFLQYEARLEQKMPVDAPPASPSPAAEIPLFPDFKVACGHFRRSPRDLSKVTQVPLPAAFVNENVERLFIARASGASMDGGSAPIKEDDYLLFRLLADTAQRGTQVHETEPSGYTPSSKAVLVENRADSADEFLLRDLITSDNGRVELCARNPQYSPLTLSADMEPVAELVCRIDPMDLHVHRGFMREDIPTLFGLEFNSGVWNSGHICPTQITDQILLVTLNKQGKVAKQQYHDYFINQTTFHWQSQNSTAPEGKKGKAIVEHKTNGSEVHLFVRKNKLRGGKASPFTYCGRVDYLEHNSEKPMNVTWRLQTPISAELLKQLQG